jgi:hypothetical protein
MKDEGSSWVLCDVTPSSLESGSQRFAAEKTAVRKSMLFNCIIIHDVCLYIFSLLSFLKENVLACEITTLSVCPHK